MNLKRLKEKPIVVINCLEEIPCNPCETICPYGAIKVGEPIVNIPVLDEKKCIGCGKCIPVCPGLCISVLNYNYSDNQATLTVPYEFLPLPKEREKIIVLNKKGEYLSKGKITRVIPPERNNRTALVTFSFPKKFYKEVCFFVRKNEAK